jgi:hypothetical protein
MKTWRIGRFSGYKPLIRNGHNHPVCRYLLVLLVYPSADPVEPSPHLFYDLQSPFFFLVFSILPARNGKEKKLRFCTSDVAVFHLLLYFVGSSTS